MEIYQFLFKWSFIRKAIQIIETGLIVGSITWDFKGYERNLVSVKHKNDGDKGNIDSFVLAGWWSRDYCAFNIDGDLWV